MGSEMCIRDRNKTWVQLTQDFVKEWPEVLEGLHFQNMPVKYLLYINIILKNNITIHYDIAKELKYKKQETIARFLKKTIEENYLKTGEILPKRTNMDISSRNCSKSEGGVDLNRNFGYMFG